MKKSIVGLKELRENTEKYIQEVKKGKSFLVIRRSRAVFRISSPEEDESQWETIFDATRDNKGVGVDAKDLLKALKADHLSYGRE